MKVTITGRHLIGKVPEMLEEMLKSKVEHLERFGHKLNSVHAIFDKEKYLYTAELTLSAKGMNLVGKAKHPKDLLTCMEEALEKVEVQLKRHESKRIDDQRRRTVHRPG